MYRVYACLTGEHDWRLVVLAVLVCLLASLVAVSLFHRARSAHGRACLAWLTVSGFATGCGIWATHFIAMLAYEAAVPVAYDVAQTALSLAVATVVTFAGLSVAVASTNRWAAPLGGAIVGAGVAGMHYTGMYAMQLPGFFIWIPELVVASVVLGVLFGAAALAVAVRYGGVGAIVAAAALLTIAIASHHFTAMGALLIAADSTLSIKELSISPSVLALAIAGAATAILGMSLVGAIADSHLARRTRQFARARQQLIADSEEKLREQNVLLDTALNNMSQGLCMFDENEKIVVFNRRYLEMYRLSPQAVKRGCTLRELLSHRKDAGLLEEDPDTYYRQIVEGMRQDRSETRIIKTTDNRSILAFNQPMPGGGWVTTHEDITERRDAEEQIREQKVQLDIALDNMSQGLLMFDAETRLVLCNRRYREMYRLPAEAVTPGTPLLDLLLLRKSLGTFGRDPHKYIAELRTALAEGRPVKLVAELTDGRIVSVANQPMPDGRWVSTHEDITEQRRSEERLQEQKLQLDTALNNMMQGLNMFDSAGRLVVCNERYLQMYRLSPDVCKPGCSVDDLVKARIAAGTFFDVDPDRYAVELMGAMTRREPTESIKELTDGRVISVTSQPTPDGNGWVVTHEDITERRRAERERDRSQAFATTVIENVPTTIVVKDARDMRYVLVNRAAEEHLGVRREEMVGCRAEEVFSAELAATIAEHDRVILETGEPQYFDEHPVTTPRGDRRIVTSMRMPIRSRQGELQYLLTVIDDRTHRKRAEAQIAYLGHHDALTGLPNRAAFHACLDATVESNARSASSFALLCIDIDRFKEINDVFGHAAGDEVLREMSRRMQIAVGGGFVARLGGDEFTIIATDGEQPTAAERLADRLLALADEEIVIDGRRVQPAISIGIAIFPTDGDDVASLVANANAALYRAKSEGRGAYRFFEANMDRRLRDRRALQQDLRLAIERNELALHYQPQASIDGRIVGFEALVRWQHPMRGFIPPVTFIALAEDGGLINALGEWVLREACREAASWPKPLQIAINLSPVQFRNGDLPGLVHSVLLETGLAPSRLELEITEGVLIGDFSRAVTTLRRLKLLGVRIAMDDFGTGYSSLSYLQSFPFDKIKIDQAFISNLERNPQSATIIRAVIGLARGLDLPVLAEGVETNDQLAFLAKEACDQVQGYLIGRPLPIEEYAELVGLTSHDRLAIAAS